MKPFRNARKLRRYRKLQTPKACVTASVEIEDNRYNISVGDKSFFVATGRKIAAGNDCFDFAVFGLAALSMSNNIEITFVSPVSSSAADQVQKLRRAFDTWTNPNLAPLRLHLAEIVDIDTSRSRAGKAICMSGGIDSTAAAIDAVRSHGFTHGMLIAGADYPDASAAGFLELRSRVAEQAEILGIDLLITETNVRSCGFKWEMLFSLNLAMCLHAQSDMIGTGGIGADFSEVGDLALHPWGTSHALTRLFGTDSMEIIGFNRDRGRTEKLRHIVDHNPDLIGHMSFCWQDTSQGGNCGKCHKCMRTKLNFIAALGEVPDIFAENPPMSKFVADLKVPERLSGIRIELVQIGNIFQNLPEGQTRTLLSRHYAELKEAYVAGMPIP